MRKVGFDNDDGSIDQELDRRLDGALASAPVPAIPPGFAARVAAMAPPRPGVATRASSYGRNSIVLCAVVLLAALLWLAPHATAASTFAIALEWMLCAQLSVLATYFAFALARGWQRSAL